VVPASVADRFRNVVEIPREMQLALGARQAKIRGAEGVIGWALARVVGGRKEDVLLSMRPYTLVEWRAGDKARGE